MSFHAVLSIGIAWGLICGVALVVPSRVRRARPTVQPPTVHPASEQDDVTWLPYLPPVPQPAPRSAHDTDWLTDQPTEVLLTETLVNRRCAEILAIEGLS